MTEKYFLRNFSSTFPLLIETVSKSLTARTFKEIARQVLDGEKLSVREKHFYEMQKGNFFFISQTIDGSDDFSVKLFLSSLSTVRRSSFPSPSFLYFCEEVQKFNENTSYYPQLPEYIPLKWMAHLNKTTLLTFFLLLVFLPVTRKFFV